MTEAVSILPGPVVPEGLAPDIAGRIAMALELVERLRCSLAEKLAAFAGVPAALRVGLEQLRDHGGVVPTALTFCLMVAAGLAAERLLDPRTRSRGDPRPDQDAGARLVELLLAGARDLAGVLIFGVAASAVMLMVGGQGRVVPAVLLTYLAAVVIVRLVVLGSRALLSPGDPARRLCVIGDRAARFLHRQNVLAAAIGTFGFLTCGLLAVVGSGDGPVHQLMLLVSGAGACLVLGAASLIARADIAADLLDACPQGGPLRAFARAWPYVSALAVLAAWLAFALVGLFDGRLPLAAGAASLAILVGLPHVLALLERVRRAGDSDMVRVAARLGQIVLLVALPALLTCLWTGGLPRQEMGQAALQITLVLLLAYLVWELAKLAIDRRLRAENPGLQAMGDDAGQGASRLATLLPPLRVSLQAAVLTIATLSVLSAMNIDIRPLLAGAGVVGLAVGFGAQTLVRDVISGMFFLLDDAFRRGEYIDVGAVKGTVERISIRSFTLRHHRGALHTIPFGQISHLTNYSRDWAIMKLVFRLPFDTDVALIGKLFKQIGRDLQARPDIGQDFIEPFKSQGVSGTDDDALLIRAKFTARPGRQFVLRREIYAAVQQAFAQHGILPTGRGVKVHFELAGGAPATSAPSADIRVLEPAACAATG
jgi:moderate conductance mechanosensitive channel